MKALILSGGGALGAFQVGAEKYAREVKGYQWDVIAGISIGALNGAMMAQGKYQRLYELWSKEMSNRLVFGPLGHWPTGLLPRFLSAYRLRPVRRIVERELRQGKFQVPLRVGAVSLITGEYKRFTEKDPHILEAVMASAAVPIIRPPVDVGPNDPRMVDGGIRNTSPVGDVLAENPDEIVIINCLPRDPDRLATPPRWLVGIGIRSFELMVNEIFVEDIKEFELINALVKEAKERGVDLHHPDVLHDAEGRPYRRLLREVQCKRIEPESSLGDGLDFSIEEARRRLDEGRRMAQKVLG